MSNRLQLDHDAYKMRVVHQLTVSYVISDTLKIFSHTYPFEEFAVIHLHGSLLRLYKGRSPITKRYAELRHHMHLYYCARHTALNYLLIALV